MTFADVDGVFGFANLHQRYLECRKNKRNTFNALRFEARQELNLLELSEALQNRSYRPSSSVCFVTERPKLREIFAADFRDRIVHHVLVHELEPYWERVFIHDSYACRPNKGIHKAVDRLSLFMRQATCNGQRRVYFLQLDIANYFMRIDKAILWSLLKAQIQTPELLWLCKLLVFHDCTEQFIYKGKPDLLQRVPTHKTLLRCEPGKGLPIGNLNSQFFANVYLNRLDQFVKHQLKCRFYLRYCDDFILLDSDPQRLHEWQAAIRLFLDQALQLSLNEKHTRLRPISDGVDFLGYVVRRDYRLVRRRVINNLRSKLRAFERCLVQRDGDWVRYRFDLAVLEQCRACLASYLGHMKHADSFSLRQALWAEFAFLAQYFVIDAQCQQLKPLYVVPRQFVHVRQQYAWFRQQFAADVVLFRVGCFYELYHSADQALAEQIGLKRLADNRRRALFGVPVVHKQMIVHRLPQQVSQILWVGEQVGGLKQGRVKTRMPMERWQRQA